jgi:hypothetical protein
MADLGFPRTLGEKYNRRPCPQCDGADAAAHPLAIGAVVTVLRFRNRCPVAEGIATILRPACEPDNYFIRFRGEARIETRLIFPDYQHDPARAIDIVTRHLASASRLASTSTQSPTPGERS